MITINNLSKVYETKKVLSIENLEFPKGQTIGLVGNNGAGKTTLFSLILDLFLLTKKKSTNPKIGKTKSVHL